MNPNHYASRWRLKHDDRAATVASALPPRPSFRHAFAHSRNHLLDLLCRAGYSPELTGHMPLIDFCNRMDPRARRGTISNPHSLSTTSKLVEL